MVHSPGARRKTGGRETLRPICRALSISGNVAIRLEGREEEKHDQETAIPDR
jgi:hypothetical protein